MCMNGLCYSAWLVVGAAGSSVLSDGVSPDTQVHKSIQSSISRRNLLSVISGCRLRSDLRRERVDTEREVSSRHRCNMNLDTIIGAVTFETNLANQAYLYTDG